MDQVTTKTAKIGYFASTVAKVCDLIDECLTYLRFHTQQFSLFQLRQSYNDEGTYCFTPVSTVAVARILPADSCTLLSPTSFIFAVNCDPLNCDTASTTDKYSVNIIDQINQSQNELVLQDIKMRIKCAREIIGSSHL